MIQKIKNNWPVIAIVSIMLIVFLPLLTGGAFFHTGIIYSDLWLFNYPLKAWYQDMFASGEFPFWSSLIGNGYPLFAEGQVGALYPFHLLLFNLFPTLFAFNFNIFLHFSMAAIFTYLFANQGLGLSKKASFLSAITYSLSGFFTTHIFQTNIDIVLVYLPLSFLAVDKLIRKRYLFISILSTVFILQIFAGHIEMFYYSVALTFLYLLLRTFIFPPKEAGEDTKKPVMIIAAFFAAAIISVGVTSVQTLSTYELNTQSQRSEGIGIEHATATAWPLDTLLLFINPRHYDLFRVEEGYLPDSNYTVNIHALYGYVGIIPLLLVFYALGTSRKKVTIMFGSLLILGFIYGFGRSTQFFAILWNTVPGLKFFRFPTKILFFIEFCLAVLAGIGFDAILPKIKNRYQNANTSNYIVAGLVLVSLFDLLYFNVFGIRKIVSGKEWLSEPATAQFIKKEVGSPYIYRYHTHGTNNLDYAFARDFEMQKVLKNILHIDSNFIWEVPSQGEWAVLFLQRQSMLNSYRASPGGDYKTLVFNDRYLNSLSVQASKYILVDLPLEDEGLRLVDYYPFEQKIDHLLYVNNPAGGTNIIKFPSDGIYLYENPKAYPRAMFVSDYEVVSDTDELLERVLGNDFNAKEVLFLENEPQNSGEIKKGSTGKVEIVADSQNSIEIEVETDGGGFLYLADTYYPGWKASVDGKDVEILRANYAFRAIYVSEGRHVVKMSYEPTYWRLGLLISGISLVVLIGGTVGYWVHARRRLL